MKKNTGKHWVAALALAATLVCGQKATAQTNTEAVMSTPPATSEDVQALYNSVVEDRTTKIMTALALDDAAKSNRVHAAIVAEYHALRARDEAIDDALWDLDKGSSEWLAQRDAMFPSMSQPLHDRFEVVLSRDLTPEQMEKLKDKMTYGKVGFTYKAYCSILPDLTEDDKSKILDLLKQAREVAMDGGSAGEKTAIFQLYKNKINDYLTGRGFDVVKATQEWSAKQAAKQAAETAASGVAPTK